MEHSPILVVIDFETTALKPEDGCAWQLAACAVRDETIIAEFETKIRPLISKFQLANRETVRKCSGLDDAGLLSLLDAAPFSDACDAWIEWAVRTVCPQKAAPLRVTAFNVGFDRTWYEAEEWSFSERRNGWMPVDWRPCVMDVAAKAMGRTAPKQTRCTPYGRVNTVSLADACKHFGITNEKAHDALADTRAAAELAIKLGLE